MDANSRAVYTDWTTVDRRSFLQLAGLALGLPYAAPAFSAERASSGQPQNSLPTTHAIVIGINKTKGAPDLCRPVADAQQFVHWLLTRAHVKPTDISLLLSPKPAQGTIEGVAVVEATRSHIDRK